MQGEPRAMLEVPQMDFTTLKFSSDLRYVNSAGMLNTWQWSGPSQSLQHLAAAVMGQGQILPISPPATNASWTLDFWGPSLQCAGVEGSERDRMWVNLWNSYNISSLSRAPRYLAWTPWSYADYELYYDNLGSKGIDSSHPYLLQIPGGPDIVGPPPSQVATEGAMSLYVATLPPSEDLSFFQSLGRRMVYRSTTLESCAWEQRQDLEEPLLNCTGNSTSFLPATAFDGAALLRCDLFNTSMKADFSYVRGEQNIQLAKDISLPVTGSNWFRYFLRS